MNNNTKEKEISMPLGLVVIAVFGVITVFSMISTLKKYTNYNDTCYYDESC